MDPVHLTSIEINPDTSQADSCVIWLHGLGASGHDFEPMVPFLGLPDSLQTRFVFPHAPERPVTVNQGYVMRAWYDITEVSINTRTDHPGIKSSVDQIHALIDREIDQGVSSDRVILIGFSQGGVIAAQAGFGYRSRIAGIVALSTYLADPGSIPEGNLPIFLGHGQADPIVPFSLGEQARDRLNQCGYDVSWHSYDMEHSVSMDEIRDIGNWIIARLVG